ncbi:SDR family NAD(P)-dependent oxidoreductase [Mangrovivirga cuniculi]|uniref:NAD(P)-dependent oxidoreductase n=1 Tax=Mangrovivirga cuniculi TaxID=2715131 RepID=A0A4D7JLK8_9BACT|nr:SDR family NAD(P)-dependent oxidoreductase [Mangrovivirga cuniculi]QCK14390.1 NAD(P)-dependent oxidoreductase [Mangrovivirga cuniculi]
MENKTVLITGATSGIGLATARLLGSNGFNIIACGRRKERLDELKNILEKDTRILTLEFDVRNKNAVNKVFNSLPEEWKKIDVLINNAGNAHGLDTIDQASLEDWDLMIDINVKGLLYVSRAVIPGMVSRKSGHIINIGSLAGKETYAKGNVYCGTKHAVDAISSGMRKDLLEHGIKVSQVCPGLVNTEFSEVRFKGDEKKAENVYKGMEPLYAEDIAEIIEFVITRPKHVNIADSLILPLDQASSTEVKRS